jgi:hypothetical protein
MTYVALNPCICQLATGVLKTRMGPLQQRAKYATIQPLARWIHDTLAISPLPLWTSPCGIGLAEAKLTHDEARGQLKGPRSASLLSLRSLIETDGDLSCSVSGFNLNYFSKHCTCRMLEQWSHQGL